MTSGSREMKVSEAYDKLYDLFSNHHQISPLQFGQGTLDIDDEILHILTVKLNFNSAREVIENSETIISSAVMAEIAKIARKRVETRQPLLYLLKSAYQQGYKFYVDERVLIPRSFIGDILFNESHWSDRNETKNQTDNDFIDLGLKSSQEIAIAHTLNFIMPRNQVRNVLDLCCGSGCLGILAKKVFPHIHRVDCADISSDALDVARINISNYGYNESMLLYHGNLFEGLRHPYKPEIRSPSPSAGGNGTINASKPSLQRYDLILCNPPYVDLAGMKSLPKELNYEPTIALFGGDDGLKYIDDILSKACDYLDDDGVLVCEVGRCGPLLMRKYPKIFIGRKLQHKIIRNSPSNGDFPYAKWIDTKASKGEVFVMNRKALEEFDK